MSAMRLMRDVVYPRCLKKQAYTIAPNKAKPAAYIVVFKAQRGLMKGKKN